MEDMVQKVLWGHQVNQALKETQDAVALEDLRGPQGSMDLTA